AKMAGTGPGPSNARHARDLPLAVRVVVEGDAHSWGEKERKDTLPGEKSSASTSDHAEPTLCPEGHAGTFPSSRANIIFNPKDAGAGTSPRVSDCKTQP